MADDMAAVFQALHAQWEAAYARAQAYVAAANMMDVGPDAGEPLHADWQADAMEPEPMSAADIDNWDDLEARADALTHGTDERLHQQQQDQGMSY